MPDVKYIIEVVSWKVVEGDARATVEEDDADVHMRNHGARVDGPWVICRQGTDCRYFVVEKLDKATLIPIIMRECEVGSVIHSDEWPSYGSLTDEGLQHETKKHQEHFVDSDTGAHTHGHRTILVRFKDFDFEKEERSASVCPAKSSGSLLLADEKEE